MKTEIKPPAKTLPQKIGRFLSRPFWYYPGGKAEGRAFRRPMDALASGVAFLGVAASPLVFGPQFIQDMHEAGAGNLALAWAAAAPMASLVFGGIGVAIIRETVKWPNNLAGDDDRFVMEVYRVMDKAGFDEKDRRDFIKRWNEAGQSGKLEHMDAMLKEYSDLHGKVTEMERAPARKAAQKPKPKSKSLTP